MYDRNSIISIEGSIPFLSGHNINGLISIKLDTKRSLMVGHSPFILKAENSKIAILL